MKRTTLYLDNEQLDRLRRLGERRGQPISAMIREAVDAWLETQGAQPIGRVEWEHRFDAILKRRRTIAAERRSSASEAALDVMRTVQEVRKART